ncbi:hypothetical protein ACFY1S_03480 [Micromonospora sp. NPDC000663]|uniref:hypothetical protein n=1 Tax=Micromonospora sp. NPDC000663 TaxID=3364218 RepID=UPI00369BA4ED
MTSPTALVDFDPGTDDVPPGIVIGVEQEYKWRLGDDGLFGNLQPTLDDLAAAVPPPDDAVEESRFQHTQSTLYFDDRWQLTDRQIALRATINPGTIKRVSWLGVKQTLRWENGCRDSLELGGRLAAKDIGREVRNPQSPALAYAHRLLGVALEPDVFASVVQHRRKVFYRTSVNSLLQVTFDRAEFKALPDGQPQITYWLEIENNGREMHARAALERWATSVSERVGAPPATRAKAEVAAELAGWTRRG